MSDDRADLQFDAKTIILGTDTTVVASPSVIQIAGRGRPLVTLHPDGRLEYGEDYTPDEAARMFWEAVAGMSPR
jgi:hypothetical protein